jgi:hypothetical protein
VPAHFQIRFKNCESLLRLTVAFTEEVPMIVEPCTPECFETGCKCERHYGLMRRYSSIAVMRPPYLVDPMMPSSISPVKRMAMALLSPKRRYVVTMSMVAAVRQLAFSKESMSSQHTAGGVLPASFARRLKPGLGRLAALSLPQMSYCSTK